MPVIGKLNPYFPLLFNSLFVDGLKELEGIIKELIFSYKGFLPTIMKESVTST